LVDWPYSSPAVYCEELTCPRVSNVLDEYSHLFFLLNVL
jgi:hypothetical protein